MNTVTELFLKNGVSLPKLPHFALQFPVSFLQLASPVPLAFQLRVVSSFKSSFDQFSRPTLGVPTVTKSHYPINQLIMLIMSAAPLRFLCLAGLVSKEAVSCTRFLLYT